MKKIVLLVMVIFATVYSYAEEKRYDVPIEDSPAYGPADAQVTIIEFINFQ